MRLYGPRQVDYDRSSMIGRMRTDEEGELREKKGDYGGRQEGLGLIQVMELDHEAG